MGRKRWLAAIFAAVLTAQTILAGCGTDGASKNEKTEDGNARTEQAEDGESEDGKKSEDGKTESPQEEGGETVELRFHDIIPNPAREAKFKEMVERFNEENPGIKVIYESTPWDQSHNKLVTQGSADTMPDITIMHASWASEFNSAGWIIPLDDYLAEWEYTEQFIPYVKNVLIEYDQKDVYGYTYGIPDGLTTHGMYVRKDWIEEAGMTLEDLETWEGIFAASEKMTDASQNRYGFAFRGARGGADQMGMYLLGALNGRLYEEDGTCRINTPEGLQAFKKYCSLYLDGYAPKDSINWGYAEMVQGFTSGLSGILNQTTEVTQTCKESMKDEEWTVIPFPRSADGNIYSKADSFFYTITKSSQHPKEAWKFVSFMMSPENNMEYCETNLYIPVMQGAEDDPRFTQGGMEGFVASMNDENFVRNPFYGYFPELTEFAETVYDSELQKYLLGQQTAEEAVANISDFLTEAQQRFMESSPDTPLPRAVKVDGTEIK